MYRCYLHTITLQLVYLNSAEFCCLRAQLLQAPMLGRKGYVFSCYVRKLLFVLCNSNSAMELPLCRAWHKRSLHSLLNRYYTNMSQKYTCTEGQTFTPKQLTWCCSSECPACVYTPWSSTLKVNVSMFVYSFFRIRSADQFCSVLCLSSIISLQVGNLFPFLQSCAISSKLFCSPTVWRH